MLHVVLRYDDFGYGNASYDEEVLRLSTQLELPITVGVVPGLVSGALMEALARTPRAEVAMHGIVHRRAGPSGEFAGYKDWYADLVAHFRRALEKEVGRPVCAFIPPWNMVDGRYLDLLAVAGFSVVSGGPSPSDFRMFARFPGQFVPFSTDPLALEKVAKGEPPTEARRVAVPLWHHYNVPISELRRILAALSGNQRVRFESLGSAAALFRSADAYTEYRQSNAAVQRGRKWIQHMIRNGRREDPAIYGRWEAQQFLHLDASPANEMPRIWRLAASLSESLDQMRSTVASYRHRA